MRNLRDFYLLEYYGQCLIKSYEEIIFRLHLDEHDQNRVRERDVFMLNNFFKQMGVGVRQVSLALKNLESLGLVRLGNSNDGQMSFQTSQVVSPATFHEDIKKIKKAFDQRCIDALDKLISEETSSQGA